jgi:hypothetical protein
MLAGIDSFGETTRQHHSQEAKDSLARTNAPPVFIRIIEPPSRNLISEKQASVFGDTNALNASETLGDIDTI